MADETVSLTVLDAFKNKVPLQAERNDAGQLTPHSVPEINGLPVSDSNPLPVTATPLFTPTIPMPAPSTLAADDTWDSGFILCEGFLLVSIGAELSLTGILTAQRYLDTAGRIPVGGLVTINMLADEPAWTGFVDRVPFQALAVTIQNTGVATANLSNVGVLCAAS